MATKPAIIQQIEAQCGFPLTRLENLPEPSDAVRFQHNNSYHWAQGALRAINVSESETLHNVVLTEECTGLQYLNLSENKNLAEVEFEVPLKQLIYLDLSECALAELDFPAGFDALEKAYLQKNQLKQARFQGGCNALLLLDLSGNQLAAFSLPAGFDSLAYLYLNKNQLSALEFPTRLPSLDTLHLRDNQLKNFSEIILLSAPALKSLYLSGNPLPDAMRGTIEESSGNGSIAFLERYFKDLAKGGTPDNECKVLLIGNGNVGKSCLVTRITEGKFREKWETTHAIDLKQYLLGEYLLNLWDFAGQDIYHATHRLFFQSGAVYLVLWDFETEHKRQTPYEHKGEVRQFDNHELPYWLDYTLHLGHGSPVIVVQTKTGKHGKKDLPHIRETYQAKLPFLDFQHVESEENDQDENGLSQLLPVIRRAVKRIKNTAEIPENWVHLRQALRDKLLAGDKRLSITDYLAMPELESIADQPMNVLENWLVKTGVVFYRKGLFQDEIILDQAWAIRAIYTLFDRDELFYEVWKARKGRFSGKDLAKIWAANSEGERELFVSFMLACEMCFETTARENDNPQHLPFEEKQFVAPQLLDVSKPDSLSDVWMGRKGLYLRYQHEFLHYGVIQSFIVRTQSLAEMRDIWRYGISLKEADKLALVETFEKEKTVQVVVTENGKPLLDKIWNLLEKLQDGKGVASVSVDGENFVLLEKLKHHPADVSKIETETPNVWVDAKPLSVFLSRDEKASFNNGPADEKPEADPHNFLKLTRSSGTMKNQIQKLIAQARLSDALELLASSVPTHLHNEVIQLQGKLAKLEGKERIGVLSFQEAGLERAKITDAVLELCDTLDAPTQPEPRPVPDREKQEIVEPEGKTKILFISANPGDQPRLQTDEEHRKLKAQLERGRARAQFVFLQPQLAVTDTELIRALNDKPNIIHFSGHGTPEGIIITKEDNSTQPIPTPALQFMFKRLKGIAQIVILNACYSAEQARVISEFGMYVVGTSLPITDPAAISFSEGFYLGLGEGKDFEGAFIDAMTIILTRHPEIAAIIEVWKDGKKLDI
ncbi:MAG: COR domain-containing protein [Saprospiraceae bacterium]